MFHERSVGPASYMDLMVSKEASLRAMATTIANFTWPLLGIGRREFLRETDTVLQQLLVLLLTEDDAISVECLPSFLLWGLLPFSDVEK